MEPYYDRDGITLYHADCRDVLPLIDPATVSLVLTDPPYGMSIDTDYSKIVRNKEWTKRKGNYGGNTYERVIGDNEPFDPSPLLQLGRPTILFGADNYSDKLPASRGWIVWDKRDGLDDNMFGDAEVAWTSFPMPTRVFRHKWAGYMRASEVGKHLHPTQKPVALMRWILSKWSKPGDLILDPYMGSGPIARACLDLGRQYVGIELHEPYVQTAVKRLSQQVLPLGDVA